MISVPKITPKTGWPTAAALVIANMIGSGIFVSLGFQLKSTPNTWSIFILWTAGALMALSGAFSYAELGTILPRSGGEYHFLSKIYHPLLGYLSGWVSITIGFAAPVALSAMAIGGYVELYSFLPEKIIAILCVIIVSLFHSITLKSSSLFQNITTLTKVLLIIIFIISGFLIVPDISAFDWGMEWQNEIVSPAFAVSFVFVTFSYSGWNSATYIIDEIKDVKRGLPKALISGTLLVSLLYLLLNFVFLRQASLELLKGEIEIGQIVASQMYGFRGGMFLSIAIAAMLISGISAMIWAGSRVTQVVGEDYRIWKLFARRNAKGIPMSAIWLQSVIAISLIITGSFEQVLIYSGFILQLFAALTVGGVILLRRRDKSPQHFKSPLYPFPQGLFLLMSCWVLVYLMIAQPKESSLGLMVLLIGALTYWINKFIKQRR